MRIVLGTNFWSHHQAPVATELARILGPDRFRMAVFEEVSAERRAMGWGADASVPWLIGPSKTEEDQRRLHKTCLDADVMVFGACPPEVLSARADAGRLTLVAAERKLKKGLHRLRLLNPRYARGMARFRRMVEAPNVHALAIGHHAAPDLRTIGAFADRIWRWGYFVQVAEGPPAPAVDRPMKVLWVGRMLGWKRIDTLLRALAILRDSPGLGECLLVGDGPEQERLQRLAGRLRLDPLRVRFEQPVHHAAVRDLMRRSDVYVLPSDGHEGWGAVAGEAMSEGCVLVANEEAGAARELVADGVTGLLFRDADHRQLAAHLERLGRDGALRSRLRQAAWERMTSLWSPRVAAERLVSLAEGLLSGRPPAFFEGPCSRAP